jgi:low affinity Fe/Cu permease
MPSIDKLMKARKPVAACICLVLLLGIGLVDYLIGYRISLIVLYVLPIGFATIYVGRIFAIILAISSVVIWMGGDLLAGSPYPGLGIQLWNGGIVLSLFLIVVFLLHALRQALDGLEAKVRHRGATARNDRAEAIGVRHPQSDRT